MNDYLDLFSLKGKTVFVTGGLGLLGSEICRAVSSAGANTVMLDIKDEKEFNKFKNKYGRGRKISYEEFDIADIHNLDMKIDTLYKKYKKIDVWINNAYPRTEDWGNNIEDIKLNSFVNNINMHLVAYSWISRKICLLMREHGGVVLNIGSIYGILGPDFSIYENTTITNPLAYSPIKAGIINITRYLASYFGKYNVRINNLCPGGIFDNQDAVFVKNYSNRTPLNRMGNPEEVASVALFLSSDASSYITGSTVMVDGGWSII